MENNLEILQVAAFIIGWNLSKDKGKYIFINLNTEEILFVDNMEEAEKFINDRRTA